MQRNRGRGGQKEETGKSELEEQKSNPTMRRSWEGARESKPLTTKGTKITKERQRKSSRFDKNLIDSSAEEQRKRRTERGNRKIGT